MMLCQIVGKQRYKMFVLVESTGEAKSDTSTADEIVVTKEMCVMTKQWLACKAH